MPSAPSSSLHRCAVLGRLLFLQTRGKFRRTYRAAFAPRRRWLTLAASALVILWLSNAIAALLLRSSPSESQLPTYAPLGMLFILALKIARIVIDRNEAGHELRNADVYLLGTRPYLRSEIRLHKTAGHAVSIVVTALIASLFLWPDVPMWISGFLGALAAMLFIHLIYMITAVVVGHASDRFYLAFRVAAVITALTACAAIGSPALASARPAAAALLTIESFAATPMCRLIVAPLLPFSHLLCSGQVFPDLLGWSAACGLMVVACIAVLMKLEPALIDRAARRERQHYLRTSRAPATERCATRDRGHVATRIPWAGGAGPIAWRQFVTLRKTAWGTAQLLLLAAVVSGLFLSQMDRHQPNPVTVIAAVAVFSFFLLPNVLNYDFRRDVDYMAPLKMLPLPTRAIVAGELTLPVALATACQLLMLTVVFCASPSAASLLGLAALFLVPLNLFFFGIENIVFLLYPYRLQAFDLPATVRRTLMLFGKFVILGALFLTGILAALAVAFVSNRLADTNWGNLLAAQARSIYWIGCWVLVTALAAASFRATCWAYDRFDATVDRAL